jgi:hypothetical protein
MPAGTKELPAESGPEPPGQREPTELPWRVRNAGATSVNMAGIVAFIESHESCKLDLEIASEEASRLFVEIYEKLETRKVDPGIDFNALVEVFREVSG